MLIATVGVSSSASFVVVASWVLGFAVSLSLVACLSFEASEWSSFALVVFGWRGAASAFSVFLAFSAFGALCDASVEAGGGRELTVARSLGAAVFASDGSSLCSEREVCGSGAFGGAFGGGGATMA